MSRNNDGGPAFGEAVDVVYATDPSGSVRTRPGRLNGMSLRDYFAGQALANATLMNERWEVMNEHDAARVAYVIADAMLLERAK